LLFEASFFCVRSEETKSSHFIISLEKHMAEAQEKRAARRFALKIPVAIAREDAKFSEAAQIRDVSARGISLYLDSPIAQGSPIGFTLTLPPEITLTESRNGRGQNGGRSRDRGVRILARKLIRLPDVYGSCLGCLPATFFASRQVIRFRLEA
jgi:hypothetical protein